MKTAYNTWEGIPKLIVNDSFDFSQDLPLVRLADDPAVLRKQAGETDNPFVAEWADVKPTRKDASLVHLIALGDFEKTGCNRNGDAFTADFCAKNHPSFVKCGALYRHHCFIAGTLITMGDKTRKPIECIKIGEEVFTKDGVYPVAGTIVRQYAGPGVKLGISGVPDELVCTADHPIFVLKRKDVFCRHGYNTLTKSTHTQECNECKGKAVKFDYRSADKVEEGDFVFIPKPTHGEFHADPNFAELIGWMASEGNYQPNGAIQFTFSEKNTVDINAVKSCLEKNGLRASLCPRPQYGLVMISACSIDLVYDISKYITGTLSEKKLTDKILSWDEESLLRMLGSYIDGDGHVASGKNKGQLRIRSSSPQMKFTISDVIRSLGVPATVNNDCLPGRPIISPINHKTYFGRGSGVVAVNAAYSEYLCKYSRKGQLRNRSKKITALSVEGGFLARIDSVESVTINQPVYNLEIDLVHNYIASEVVVHNCNKDYSKRDGDILRSGHFDKMGRTELLVEAYHDKCADWLSRLEKNQKVAYSMGFDCKYDVCSICDNKAKTRREYCEHVSGKNPKYGMCRVLDDGRKCFVFNPEGEWNDISFVDRPADMIAYDLRKVAGLDSQEFIKIGSAELAEAAGLGEGGRPRKVVEKLSTMEKRIPGGFVRSVRRDATEVDSKVASRLRSMEPGEMFAELASAGVVLPAHAFFKLALGEMYPQAESVVKEACALSDNLFSTIQENPAWMDDTQKSLSKYAADIRFLPSLGTVETYLLQESFSIRPDEVQARLMKRAAGNVELTFDKSASMSSPVQSKAEALAREYAAYKIAAVIAIEDKTGQPITDEVAWALVASC